MLRVRTEFQAQVKETEGSIQSLISCVTYASHQSHSPSLSVSVKQRAWIRSEFPTHFKTKTPKVHSLTKLSLAKTLGYWSYCWEHVALSYFTNCNSFICLNKSSALMVKTLFIQFTVTVRSLNTLLPLAINHLLPLPCPPSTILNFSIKWPQRFLSVSSFDSIIC